MTGEFTDFERAMIRVVVWVQAVSGVLGGLTVAFRIIDRAIS
jgi:hypothetical protein